MGLTQAVFVHRIEGSVDVIGGGASHWICGSNVFRKDRFTWRTLRMQPSSEEAPRLEESALEEVGRASIGLAICRHAERLVSGNGAGRQSRPIQSLMVAC